MNSNELKAQMVRKDVTVDQICAAIGISRTSWFRKIGGSSEFSQGEITDIRRLLDLDDHMTAVIFFSGEVS